MPKVGVLSDTHGSLPESAPDFFASCSEIWHAGDVGNIEVLNKLTAICPVKAVYGNIDGQAIRQCTTPFLSFTFEELYVLIRHIGGRPGAYTPETRKQVGTLKPDILICGHSHILLITYNEAEKLMHINPGAAGNSGFHKMITMLRFDINGRNISNMELWEKPRKAAI